MSIKYQGATIAGLPPIDSALDPTSNNAIANNTVTTALAGKQNAIMVNGVLQGNNGTISATQIDTTPAKDSDNLITSGGVFSNTMTTYHTLADNTDLNSVTTPGVYGLSGSRIFINYPIPSASAQYGVLEVVPGSTGNICIQRLTRLTDIFIRYMLSTAPTWSDWEKIGSSRTFTDITVATSAWGTSTLYTGYPYRAAITCTGITDSWMPEVIFNPSEATSGNFAPVATSATDIVYIYAKVKPTTDITIPRIRCEY